MHQSVLCDVLISHIVYLTNPCPTDYRDIHPVTTPVSVMMNQNWYASGVLYSALV
jgi:hypothetical protein